MRNVIGFPAEGENFYNRPKIINTIHRRVQNDNLFMAAPRRSGKTSIMKYLQQNPQEGFHFIYATCEEIYHAEDFYKTLLEVVLNSDAVKRITKFSAKSKGVIESVVENIKKIGIFGVELELQSKKSEFAYYEQFKELCSKLNESEEQIVIMIDEFPSAVENIGKATNAQAAVHFLQQNRSIRQNSTNAIRFIYTGSIGLPVLVNKLGFPEAINDLNTVNIPPLSDEEAKELVTSLLASFDIKIELAALDYLVKKIEWLMPFFIQLSIQELVEVYDDNPIDINIEMVDLAFQKMYGRRNSLHLSSYSNRLKDAFVSENEYIKAKEILAYLSEHTTVDKAYFFPNKQDEVEQRAARYIFDTLEFDGYIFYDENTKHYRFNSPILRNWWKNNIH